LIKGRRVYEVDSGYRALNQSFIEALVDQSAASSTNIKLMRRFHCGRRA